MILEYDRTISNAVGRSYIVVDADALCFSFFKFSRFTYELARIGLYRTYWSTYEYKERDDARDDPIKNRAFCFVALQADPRSNIQHPQPDLDLLFCMSYIYVVCSYEGQTKLLYTQ